VLGWRGPPGPDALSRYATSWALVHLLLHRRPEAFAAYQARLARGEDPDAAWRAELPEWDPATPGALAALDRTLAAYVRGPLEGAPHPAPPGADLVGSEQLMPSVEVHALRLALWSHGPEQGQAALRAEVAEALREDPDHPVALQVEAELAHADARPFARAAVRAHPDDPRAWTFLGSALDAASEQAEREAAYRRAADLAPDNAAALVNLVRALLAGGRSGEALPHARRAAALAPWSPPVLDAYAATLSDLGRCAEAIPIQQRALEVLPEGTAERAFRSFRDRLAGYAEQCRLALAPGASAPPERVERAPEVGGQRRDERDPRPGARVIER
jgi:tetratricopeptide (TPR) repeat protein